MEPELDARKIAVLTAIVREFIRGGEPVGSKRLVDGWDLKVSSATVRSDMAALEEAGYITHPHRSAGRVPTDKGYRFFVDAATGAVTGLPAEQQNLLEGLLEGAHDLEDLLRRATNALSRLTRFAALVASPRLDRARVRHIELVQLSPMSLLVVLIADTGRVSKRFVELPSPTLEHDVQRVRHAVNDAAVGLRAGEVAGALSGLAEGAPSEVADIVVKVAEAVAEDVAEEPLDGDRVFVTGTSTLADGQFAQLEEVKRVYETLEEQVVVLQVLQDALSNGDPGIRIGAELPLRELEACSVVATSYDAREETAGSLGVLGPMRMDYAQTLVAVRAVADTLGKAIADMTGTQGK